MLTTNPYLVLNGNSKEAIELYQKAFDAKAEVRLYKDMPDKTKIPAGMEDKVVWAEIKRDDLSIMVSDSLPNDEVTIGNNLSISVSFASVENAKASYEILSEGGKIIFPGSETYFADFYTKFVDKFGTVWQFAVYLPLA